MRGENHHLVGLELNEHRHQQTLTLDPFNLAVAENLFKEHPFVGNVLVDDP